MNRALPTLCVLVCSALPGNLSAQERAPDSLYLTGELISGSSAQGGNGGAEWVHSMSPRSGLNVGGYSMRVADNWWTYGRVGTFTRRGDYMFSGTVDVGAGQQPARRSAYTRIVGSVAVPLSHRLYAETEVQVARADTIGTRVLKVGALYTGLRSATARLAYFTSSANGVRWQYLAGRGDVKVGRIGLMGGATVGTSGPPDSTLGALALLTRTSRELFVGGSVTSGRAQMIGALEVIQQSVGRLDRLSLVVRLPLGSRSPVTLEASQ